jgi:hypothetical protein
MSVPFGNPDAPLFSLPAVNHKKVVAAFDGGRITSDGGVILLTAVERTLGSLLHNSVPQRDLCVSCSSLQLTAVTYTSSP